MLNIVCFNAGNYCGRGKEYTEKLYDMVIRNLPDGFEGRFVCFTDDTEPYNPKIEKRPIHGSLKGWWNCLYAYKAGFFDPDDQIIMMGLDTCITGPLDDIASYRGNYAILRDVYREDGYQNSVVSFKAGFATGIWDLFEAQGFPDKPGGDQAIIEEWLAANAIVPDILTDFYPRQIVSYKVNAAFQIPQGARIVFFHGHPRPHECSGNWVEHVWKIGGGTVAEWLIVGNVPDETLKANVERTLSSSVEVLADQYMTPRDEPLIICGGGPSLEDDILYIRMAQRNGAVVWALNNSFRYLYDKHKIKAQAQVILDARPENIAFVPEETDALLLYSAQCDASVIKKGWLAGKVVTWCPSIPDIIEILKKHKKRAAIMAGGSSVGLKALALAQLFGFKDVHLCGYDSSYRDGKNHAYPQPLNDKERIIDIMVNDRQFKCAPWMATQVEEFRHSAQGFLDAGMQISVHGDGLLPYMASLMIAP